MLEWAIADLVMKGTSRGGLPPDVPREAFLAFPNRSYPVLTLN
jgi:hypothetical protein